MLFRWPQKYTSAGMRSGDLRGHETGPFRPIHRHGYWLSKYRMTSREEWAGISLCSNRIFCCPSNGTSSSSFSRCSDRNCKNRTLTVEAVAHKDLGGDHQLFPRKYLLPTADKIVFLQRNMDFQQPLCAGH